MGKFLFVGAMVRCSGAIITSSSSTGMLVISVAAIGMLLGPTCSMTWKQIMDGGETNHHRHAGLYTRDLFNVFQSLLALLGIFGG